MSVAHPDAVRVVAALLQEMTPAYMSPFLNAELGNAAATRVLERLHEKGWRLMSAGEVEQLEGAQRELRSVHLGLADASRELRGFSDMLERRLRSRGESADPRASDGGA